MKILVVPQSPYFLARGGMEVQQQQTIAALTRRGVDVELYNPWKSTLEADVVHVFGSEPTHAAMVDSLVAHGIPVVTTAMFVPIHASWKYALYHKVKRVVPGTIMDLRKRLLEQSSHLIALTSWERKAMSTMLNLHGNPITVVSNGVDHRFFTATPDEFVDRYQVDDMVLCVGRIEPLKNQLRVAQAMVSASLPTVFVGDAARRGDSGDAAYLAEFERMVNAHSNLRWIRDIQHESTLLPSAYASARVHVLASTAEAQGMVTFEAAAAGCRLVVSDIPTQRELLQQHATYVNPYDTHSIEHGIQQEFLNGKRQESVPDLFKRTWDTVAEELVSIYQSVIR